MKHKITHLVVDHDPFTVRFMCNGRYLRVEFAIPLTEWEIIKCYPDIDWNTALPDRSEVRAEYVAELSNCEVLDGFLMMDENSWIEIPFSKDLKGHQ